MKERMITRTITETVVTIMGIDTNSNMVSNVGFTFTGTFKDDDDIITAAKIDSIESFIPVKVVSKEEREILYGLEESVFVKYARVLPARTKTE